MVMIFMNSIRSSQIIMQLFAAFRMWNKFLAISFRSVPLWGCDFKLRSFKSNTLALFQLSDIVAWLFFYYFLIWRWFIFPPSQKHKSIKENFRQPSLYDVCVCNCVFGVFPFLKKKLFKTPPLLKCLPRRTSLRENLTQREGKTMNK